LFSGVPVLFDPAAFSDAHSVLVHAEAELKKELFNRRDLPARASVFAFHPLSDEVTSRWLSETCPGERLKKDDADRVTRFVRDSFNDSPNSAVG
jgi:hypothetical protein